MIHESYLSVGETGVERGGEHWLNRGRLMAYTQLCSAVFAIVMGVWLASAKHLVDVKGEPVGYDFITYWSAAKLAAGGHAVDAYNLAAIARMEHTVVPGSKDVFAWYYPPAFYLIVLPLAWVPYLVAYAAFGLGTLGAYLVVIRRVVRGKEAMWCLAGFSGVWFNLMLGQNGFLTAALAAGGLLYLEKNPVAAGVLIGALAVKPHLALLFPVALIAARAWKALAVAAVMAVGFTAAGVGVLGIGTLKGCVGSLGTARGFLETGALPWARMPTVFGFLRLYGVPVGVAYAVHGAVAVAAAWVVWQVWRGSKDMQVRGAALMTATFLISPYVFYYDLTWLAFAIAWMAVAGMRDGWLKGEREMLVAAWLLPFAMAPLTSMLHLQPGPWVIGGLLWCVGRRAGLWRSVPPRVYCAKYTKQAV